MSVQRTRRLHMIGNAHIDPVWLWQWPEGYQEVRATFRSAIDRMDEYPEFVFTCNSVLYLAWVEESDPELFERIRERVAEGRWEVIGGWWVEPDCNLPHGESFVRQALYGQRWLQEKLGIVATAGGNVDSFGHAATLPQLLAKAGLESYVFLRPEPRELELPGQYFWWESADGSRVLAYRIPNQYTTPGTDLAALVAPIAELTEERPELMMFYGVGNHGGGPTRANLDSIRRLDGEDGLPALECSSLREFFERVREEDGIPTWRDELQHHAVGCYSAHSGVKQWNRRAESLLLRAEKWAAVADAAARLRLGERDQRGPGVAVHGGDRDRRLADPLVRVLILLPPSEGKTAPRRGKPLDLDALSSPSLAPRRSRSPGPPSRGRSRACSWPTRWATSSAGRTPSTAPSGTAPATAAATEKA